MSVDRTAEHVFSEMLRFNTAATLQAGHPSLAGKLLLLHGVRVRTGESSHHLVPFFVAADSVPVRRGTAYIASGIYHSPKESFSCTVAFGGNRFVARAESPDASRYAHLELERDGLRWHGEITTPQICQGVVANMLPGYKSLLGMPLRMH